MSFLWTALAGALLIGLAGLLSAAAARPADDPGHVRMIEASFELARHMGR